MDGLIDTAIIIDIYRGHNPALDWWDASKNLILGIPPIVWMEVVEGSTNKIRQAQVTQLLSYFEIVLLTTDDQLWALRQLAKYNLSHNVDLTDALIAAPAHRLNLPLYTRNTKHFMLIIPDLVTQPY